MFWRGGMTSGYWNRAGWFRRGPLMGQDDMECTGDVCIPIVSRLDPSNAKKAFEKMQYAMTNKPDCLTQAGSEKTRDEVAAKLERASLGITDEAGLTRAQADFLSKFEACVGEIPSSARTPAGTPQAQGSDLLLPAAVAAGALGIAALVTVLSGTKF